MISVNNLKTGLTVEIDNKAWRVVDFQHVKPGKGPAFVRTKLRNVQDGTIQDKTFRAGEKINQAHVEKRKMQYLYSSGNSHVFMDADTYEQIELETEQIKDELNFLTLNMTISLLIYQGDVIGIELPKNVELTVSETEPGLKGDTASGGSKPATLETGYVVQVPLFISEGETLVIDTSEGKYVSRAK